MAPEPRQLKPLVESRVGKTLNNKWQLESLIGTGGMAAVYKAVHRNGKRVAIKILHPIFPAATKLKERFLREGYLANKVDHPGAVSVLDDDTTEEGEVFLVMELLEGVCVEDLLYRFGGTMPVPHVLAIADQVLDVLIAAHAKRVIHRDLKPGNLFLTRERRVKVLDFGLARLNDPSPTNPLTAAGVLLGTPGYMPPEQARGQWALIDGRTDLFAVGAVMYRLLSGKALHEGATVQERQALAQNQAAGSLALVAPTVPAHVVAMVDKALAFKIADRWPDAATFQAAVRAAMNLEAPPELANVHAAPPVSVPAELQQPTISDAAPQPTVTSIEVEVSLSEVPEPETVRSGTAAAQPSETSMILIDQILSRVSYPHQ